MRVSSLFVNVTLARALAFMRVSRQKVETTHVLTHAAPLKVPSRDVHARPRNKKPGAVAGLVIGSVALMASAVRAVLSGRAVAARACLRQSSDAGLTAPGPLFSSPHATHEHPRCAVL